MALNTTSEQLMAQESNIFLRVQDSLAVPVLRLLTGLLLRPTRLVPGLLRLLLVPFMIVPPVLLGLHPLAFRILFRVLSSIVEKLL